MKKIYILTLMIFLSWNSFAQKICFTDTSNIWKCWDYRCGGDEGAGSTWNEHYAGDTTINGERYHKTLPNNYMVREDTANKKVWAIRPMALHVAPIFDSSEHLLYDYNLVAGDTIHERYFSQGISGIDTIPIIEYVWGIDSTTIGGVWHKVWHLQSLSNTRGLKGYTVVEGLGCTSNPMYPLYPYFFENCKVVSCFHNSGATPPIAPPVGLLDNASSCSFTFGVGVREIKSPAGAASVVPNPVDETSGIILLAPINDGEVVIINCTGQSVFRSIFTYTDKVLIGDKITQPGVYCYRITDLGSGTVYQGKFAYHP